jgi:multidrug efflux pump subunit AcrA (membrane-fusion protein)
MRFEGRAMALRFTTQQCRRLAACAAAILLAMLTACGEENRYVAPPPPKVTVALPVQQKITRYLEATGYTAAISTTIWSLGCRASWSRSTTRTGSR